MTRLEICKIIRKNAEDMILEHTRKIGVPPDKHGLCGWCAICALAVETAFKKFKYRCRSFCGSYIMDTDFGGKPCNHCWTECYDDNKIYDVTASQFHEEEVLIVPETDLRYQNRRDELSLDNPSYWSRYPQEQRPTAELIEKLISGIFA